MSQSDTCAFPAVVLRPLLQDQVQISAAFLLFAYRPSQVVQKLFQGGHARIRPRLRVTRS